MMRKLGEGLMLLGAFIFLVGMISSFYGDPFELKGLPGVQSKYKAIGTALLSLAPGYLLVKFTDYREENFIKLKRKKSDDRN